MNELPFSQSCENNKQPILEQLTRALANASHVLEIAGGTGQHAEFFAAKLPHLHWQSSDIPANTQVLEQRLGAAKLQNLSTTALELDVNQQSWCDGSWLTSLSSFENRSETRAENSVDHNVGPRPFDAVFSANSLHIMSADSVEHFFLGAGKLLNPGGLLIVYGPFNYGGRFSAESNAEFDLWLKERNPESGIRDFETVSDLARHAGFKFVEDTAMPANNRLLLWIKN